MRRSPRRRYLLVAAALALGPGGCATLGTSGPAAPGPGEIHRSLLGRNQGLASLRATVEARFTFAGTEVSLPGVLQMRQLGGFRLDLLDPLDRTLAMFFGEAGGLVQYRPGQRFAASLGTFPGECRNLDPADWVRAVLAGAVGPAAGETLVPHTFPGAALEVRRGGERRQSLRYEQAGGELFPTLVSWYCGDDPVMQLRFRGWRKDPRWRIPARIDLAYPQAGLEIRIDLKEVEANPPPTAQTFFPQIPSDTRWAAWNLPK
jgi:hypothetical protein